MSNWNKNKPIVSLKNVYKSFGSLEVLKGITFDVMKGEVICIIGPSGSGKSTLIRCINALNDIQKGSITVKGRELTEPKLDKLKLRKTVGMVFQQYNLFPHKTAIENITLPLEQVHGLSSEAAIENANHSLNRFGLIEHSNKLPFEIGRAHV